MKRFFCVVFFGISMLAANFAYSAPGMYVTGKLGAGWVDDVSERVGGTKVELKHDVGAAFAVATGYDFNPLRLEAEIGWQKNSDDKVTINGQELDESVSYDVSTYSFLLNTYFDVKNDTPLSLILGAGLGTTYLGIENFEIGDMKFDDQNDWKFAYQFTGGIGYDLSEKTTLELTYRYFDIEDELTIQNAFAGIRYKF